MLGFLRAIDTTGADPFSAFVVGDFESVAVENGDDGAGDLARKGRTPWQGNNYRSFSWMRTR
jgi:hypothetical protein